MEIIHAFKRTHSPALLLFLFLLDTVIFSDDLTGKTRHFREIIGVRLFNVVNDASLRNGNSSSHGARSTSAHVKLFDVN